MFLLIKRINIFLLSFFIVVSPTINYAYAIDPIVPPFTSSASAGDVAAALGRGATGGFGAGSAAAGLAAVGVGVGSFCIASAVQGANMCGVSTPICQALTAAWISCNPNPDGSMNKIPPASDPTKPPDSHKYLYSLEPINWKHIGEIQDDLRAQNTGNPAWTVQSITFSPTTEPYTGAKIKEVRTSDGYTFYQDSGLHWMADSSPPPDSPPTEKADPGDVGKAVAGNPAAAAAVGAAAAAASGLGGAGSSNCNGSFGTFNGVPTCVPALGLSTNPSCSGYSGVVNGESVCVPALGAGGNPACSGYSGTVNGVSTCIPEIGKNPACNGYFGTFNGKPVCVAGTDTSAYNPALATADATSAANASTANPPTQRSCPANYKLDVTGICINTTIPERGNGDCKIGYVWSGNSCVAADPFNPSRPAVSPAQTPAQAAANAAAVSASTTLTQAKANAQAATADAAAHPNDQTKAAAAVAAVAALQQATLEAVAANTAATAEATAQPKPADLPAFCGWAAIVCDAIAWAKTDALAPTETSVNIKNDMPSELQSFDINKSYFNFGSQCPADVPITFSVLGKSTTLNFKYTPICDFLTKLRPFVIGSAWIAGAFIISGSSRKGGED